DERRRRRDRRGVSRQERHEQCERARRDVGRYREDLVHGLERREPAMIRLAVLLAAVALAAAAAPHAQAQWAKVPTAGVPRTRAGEADLVAPAPRARGRRPDLSGLWLADAEPLPPEAGLSVEPGIELNRYMINVAADLAPENVPLQPWAA